MKGRHGTLLRRHTNQGQAAPAGEMDSRRMTCMDGSDIYIFTMHFGGNTGLIFRREDLKAWQPSMRLAQQASVSKLCKLKRQTAKLQ